MEFKMFKLHKKFNANENNSVTVIQKIIVKKEYIL